MIKNEINIKDILRDKWKIFVSNFDGPLTKTTQFLLPSLDIQLTNTMLRCLKNAFIDDMAHEHVYTRPVFLQFAIEDKKGWWRTHQELSRNSNYVNDYDTGIDGDGKTLVMYVFSVPEKYSMDYHHFKQGRYSKFSDTYKNKFKKYIVVKDVKEESVVWQVINRTEELRRRIEERFDLPTGALDNAEEVWDAPMKEREIYNYKNEQNAST